MTPAGKLLAERIALPSVNPAFAPGDQSPSRPASGKLGEKNVADCLATVAARAAGTAGCAGAAFGSGDSARARTVAEWVSLAELERGKDLILKFLKSLP